MSRLLALLIACLIAAPTIRANDFLKSLPDVSTVLPGYSDADSVAERLGALPLSPIEGIWQMTGSDDGATFVIERAEPGTDIAPAELRMVMIRSPWRNIRPGTLLGHLVTTAKPGVYEAHIYSDFARRTGLNIPRRFTLTLNSSTSMLTFAPFKSPLKFNLFKLLPYMYRRVISVQQSRPSGLDGAVRILPATESHPLSPVYL